MVTIFNGRSRTASTSQDTSFIQVEHKMLKHLKSFSGNEWLVFTALALHIDNEGRCFPSMARIMHVTGLSAPTIRAAMRGLQSKEIEGSAVLTVNERFAEGNRQTSNEFVLFPGFGGEKPLEGEGKDSCTGEGVKTLDPFNKNQDEQDSSLQKRTRGKISKMPKTDDPAYLLYMSFRRARGWDDDFNLGEWQGVHLLLREMVRAGVTPDDLYYRTYNLMGQWKTESMVTIRAVWKHWSTATTPAIVAVPRSGKPTTIDTARSAVNIMESIKGISNSG